MTIGAHITRGIMGAVLVIGGAGIAVPAVADVAARDGAACGSTGEPAFLVQVGDFRTRRGTVRVRLFGGDPSTYFDREHALVRTQIPVPDSGLAAICVRAPAPGVYALDARHDVNGNDVTDRGDGGGVSGNPRISLLDLIFRRRPSPAVTQVTIARGVKVVPIRIQYP